MAPSAQPPQGAPGHQLQFAKVGGTNIAHLVFLQLPPLVLDRVELWSVGGQPLLLDASLPGQVVLPFDFLLNFNQVCFVDLGRHTRTA